MVKKVILVLFFVVLFVSGVAILKFNLSDSDIYVADESGKMVQIDTIEERR